MSELPFCNVIYYRDWAPVEAGISQGSMLGPLLFLLYINDIFKRIGRSIRLFTDDTSLYIIVECPDQAARIINADLLTISDWVVDWLVEFHAKKTMAMTLSRKSNTVYISSTSLLKHHNDTRNLYAQTLRTHTLKYMQLGRSRANCFWESLCPIKSFPGSEVQSQ